jgi:serine protein kinase
MNIFDKYKKEHEKGQLSHLSLDEYLKICKKDPSAYASAAERILKAIGEPELVDTSRNSKLAAIFSNRIIRVYKPFADFYGLEDIIEKIVSFFRHSAQGLEESRQILYLVGAVGSAKSSIADRLKDLMEQEPIYCLADADGNVSPVRESPLGLFHSSDSELLGIPERALSYKASPWALKRMTEYGGDLSKFTVIKAYPSLSYQFGIAKVEPGDDNNQDISALVGKLDIRKLEKFPQDDPDAYSYSGGLCKANRGLMDFVEMFKAPLKVLHPLLTATQEHNYNGTESIGCIPFDGIVVSHSNFSEWDVFKAKKGVEAFLDRIYTVRVPYCLRVSEEVKVYQKLLKLSSLSQAPCAPQTLELLARFCVMSRIDTSKAAGIVKTKIAVYNGENVKNKDNLAKSYADYQDLVEKPEGFSGISTRTAYKILSLVYNYDVNEVGADPVHMIAVIRQMIKGEDYSKELGDTYEAFLDRCLAEDYFNYIDKEIKMACLDSYDEFGQTMFDRYIKFADAWIQDNDIRDHDTGELYDIKLLDQELSKLEKSANISNPKDFRHEVVNFALRYRSSHQGNNPNWRSYEKLKLVIQSTMFEKLTELLPILSFDGQGNSADQKKHDQFVDTMQTLGYTARQVKRLVEWYLRASQHRSSSK